MEYKDLREIKDINLEGLSEPAGNSLRLLFQRYIVSEVSEDIKIGDKIIDNAFPVKPDLEKPLLQIDFNSYIAYLVLNESYTMWDECEEFDGKAFRVYSKSKFLDYVKATTYVTTDYPGPYNHYGFICLDHIINVVSIDAPIVTEYNCK